MDKDELFKWWQAVQRERRKQEAREKFLETHAMGAARTPAPASMPEPTLEQQLAEIEAGFRN